VSGNANPTSEEPGQWFDLVDLATEQVVGQMTHHGEVRHATPDIVMRITTAYDREIMVRDDEIAEELGVCFAGVETITPRDDAHDDLVFRNLGLLSGLIPRLPAEPGGPGEAE